MSDTPPDTESPPRIEDFVGEPTRNLDAWRRLWTHDTRLPISSDRPVVGPLLVLLRRLLRPLVSFAGADLWDRQRTFNLILLEAVVDLRQRFEALHAHTDRVEARVSHVEAVQADGLQDVMRYNDALYSRVDQKVDAYRREAADWRRRLERVTTHLQAGEGAASVSRTLEESRYQQLESRYRGTEAEIRDRLAVYVDRLPGEGRLLDLGCGRGEALQVFARAGLETAGVDGSAEAVARCRELGLPAVEADLIEHLGSLEPESVDVVSCFHVIEHLPLSVIPALLAEARRVLRPAGLLLVETPNALSVIAATRDFLIDPTHRRPVHPELFEMMLGNAGLVLQERLELQPFSRTSRLPELRPQPAGETAGLASLVYEINDLRDRIDNELFGARDLGFVARKSG